MTVWAVKAMGLAACACYCGTAGAVDVSSSPTGDDSVARFFHAASVLDDGRVLVTGGMGLSLFPVTLFSRDEVSVYDPAAGMFSSFGDELTIARSSHTQTTLTHGRVLVTGGFTSASGTSPGSPTPTTEIIDPFSGQVMDGPMMSEARAMHSATDLGDRRVLIAGGNSFEVMSPDSDGGLGFSEAGTLIRARTGHAAALLNDGRVLLIGGAGNGGDTLEIIDTLAMSSDMVASTMPEGADDLACARLADGRVLIVGGQRLSDGDTIDTTLLFDESDDSLVQLCPPPGFEAGVADHALVSVGRFVVLIGGESQLNGMDSIYQQAQVFDSCSMSWLEEPVAMAQPHDDFPAVAIGGGRALAIGGGVPLFGEEAPSAWCEVISVISTPADLTGDGVVDVSDLLALLSNWGDCDKRAETCPGDVNGDGVVGVSDLLALLGAWGPCS